MVARNIILAAIFGLSTFPLAVAQQEGFETLGSHLSEEELAGWSINVFIDGTGLPAGEGTVAQGQEVYQTRCVACHGVNLEGGLGPALAGGVDSLTTDKPLKTIGSYWPYATTLFDYIRRTMPFEAPQSLSNEEVYGVTAYLLHRNDILPETATVNADSLASIEMPNRDNFYVDDRPDVQATRCMENCLSNE